MIFADFFWLGFYLIIFVIYDRIYHFLHSYLPPPFLALLHNSKIIQFEGSPYYGCCNILLTQSLASPPKPSPTPFSPELELVLGSIVILRYLKYDQQLATIGAILHKAGVIIILVQVQTWEKFMLKNAFICEA